MRTHPWVRHAEFSQPIAKRRNATKKTERFWCGAIVTILVLTLFSPALFAADRKFHKVVAAPGILDATAKGIELWHDYGSYALYRVSDAALIQLPPEIRGKVIMSGELDRWWLLNLNQLAPSNAQERETKISEAEKDSVADNSAREPALHLVQFVGPIKDNWLREVETTGATIIQYIATNGYLLWADGASRRRLATMAGQGEFVQQSGPYPPSLKIGPSLSGRLNQEEDSGTLLPVMIQIYRHDERLQTEALIDERSADVLSDWTPILSYQNRIVTVRLGDVEEIARRPDVFWIDERLERHLMDEVQTQIMAGNLSTDQSGPDAPGYLSWLDGHGFSTDPYDYPIVDVTDDGIGNGTVDSGDPTLHVFGSMENTSRLAYVANCTNSSNGGGPDGHGHINTSIAGGYDTTPGFPYVYPLSSGYQRGLGINPYGRFAGTRIFDPFPDLSACDGTDTGLIKSIQDNGALINTNSWGCRNCAGLYDDSSQAYDVGVRDADLTEPGNQEMIILFSAGNAGPSAGTVGTPGNGKNMITVGASENQRPSDEDGPWTDGCGTGPSGADNAMDIISFSSRGPSPGGRVKPEVVAPGTHIQGTASTHPSYNGSGVCDMYRPSGQTTFAASSGTSHSTPAVAGTVSLAYWWLESTLGVTLPSPALMKAYLIAHPTYLTGVSANDTLPSNNQGYGMPNLTGLFDDAGKYVLNQSFTFDNSGETWVWEGAVADNSKPVRIVLAYTDAPGAIGTNPQVNDLNLAADVDGASYLGNVFSGQWSVTGGSADPFNNYEAIFLPPGTAGDIGITITGFNVAGDGVPNSGDITDQDFALVCYNCAQTPTFSLHVTPYTLDVCAPDNAVYTSDVGSILGFTDAVTLSASGNPAETTVTFSVNPVTPPGSTTMTIGNTGAAAAGNYSIEVTGFSTPGAKSSTVKINLFDAVPAAPSLLSPVNGAADRFVVPTFSWTETVGTYSIEIATDAGFNHIAESATGLTVASYSPSTSLNMNTTYYWRVWASGACGTGTVSEIWSFSTAEFRLFIGTGASGGVVANPAHMVDVHSDNAVSVFSDFPVWGATADHSNERVLLTSSTASPGDVDGSILYEWSPGGASPGSLGTITASGLALRIDGLAMVGNDLYGIHQYSNTAGSAGLYLISLPTLEASFVVGTTNAAIGGIDADPATGTIYGSNNSLAQIVEIDLVTGEIPVADYPSGETDVDGLAVGGGKIYLVPDDTSPLEIYVYDMASGSYDVSLTAPWSASDSLSGGAYFQEATFSLEVTPDDVAVCAPDSAVYTVSIGSILGFSDTVDLAVSGQPPGTTATFSVSPVTPSGSSTLTISDTGAATPGDSILSVSGTSTTGTQTRMVGLSISGGTPAAPTLLTPANGATDQSTKPALTWTEVPGSYSIQIATDAGFENVVDNAVGLTVASHTPSEALDAYRVHYWRVWAENACGTGAQSPTWSFTTGEQTVFVIGLDGRSGSDTDANLATGSDYDDLRAVLGASGHEIVPLTSFEAQDLAGLDALIVNQSYDISLASSEISAIQSFVATGRGLLVHANVTSEPSDISNLNNLVAPYGLTYSWDATEISGHTISSFEIHAVTHGLSQVGVARQRRFFAIAPPGVDLTPGCCNGADDFLAVVDGSDGGGSVAALSNSTMWQDDDTGSDRPLSFGDNALLLGNLITHITKGSSTSISIDDVTVPEGDTGTVDAVFTVSLSVASGQEVTVDYATENGTATAGSDYVAGAGALTFIAGDTEETITIAVSGDLLDEPDETFLINLSNPTNATISDGQGQGRIKNDDSDEIFADGFETGDVTAWSGTRD